MGSFETEQAAERASVRLGDRFEILPGTPAGDFRSPETEAYRALDRLCPGEARFALICEPGVPPRLPLLEPLAALQTDTLLKPLGWGVVDWPPRERRCFALIFERPASRVDAIDTAVRKTSCWPKFCRRRWRRSRRCSTAAIRIAPCGRPISSAAPERSGSCSANA